MQGCGMEPPSPDDETDELYSARHARHYCRGRAARRRPPYTCTAEVHDYPSSESGIAADCAPSRRRAPHLDDELTRDLDEILPARFATLGVSRERRESPLEWNRDNIAATMERFEPTDYCYAYYGGGGAAPGTSRSACCRSAPPRERGARHAYITRYGTEENIYEEISECRRHRHARRQSLASLGRSALEEEVRRVETRHKRVLGELNLSVEAMLMPECESPESEREEGGGTGGADGAGSGDTADELLRVGPTDELLSPASCHPPADLDSGFSGSSSGASYVGSLRYRTGDRTRAATPPAAPPGPAVSYGARGVRILERAPAHAARSSSCSDAAANTGFWSRKSWKKLPGFSSSNSINKAGLSDPEAGRHKQPLLQLRTGSMPFSYVNGKLVVALDPITQR